MPLLTCEQCGEVTEIDEEELAVADSLGVLLCSTCESPLAGEGGELEHSLDQDPLRPFQGAAGRERRALSVELVEELTIAVRELADQVRCLRLSVDEIEAELGWAIRERVIPQLAPPTLPRERPATADKSSATIPPQPLAKKQLKPTTRPERTKEQNSLW